MKKSRLLLLSTAFVALASAPLMAEDLVIGLATAQTGGLAPYDQPNLAGLQMKIEEINAAGGVNGKKLEMVFEDDQGTPEKAKTVISKLIFLRKLIRLLMWQVIRMLLSIRSMQKLLRIALFLGTLPKIHGGSISSFRNSMDASISAIKKLVPIALIRS